MKGVLRNLMERHGTYGVDWMGFNLSKKNPLTYHHMEKNCDSGEKTLANGAPLTKKAHRFLNYLEINCPELYSEWNNLFKIINQSAAPPTEEHSEKISSLREKGKVYEKIYMSKK